MVLARLLDCILRFRRSSGCCLLVEVLVVVLSRVVDPFVVGVVVFDVGGRHPSLRCLEHLLQFFRHRPSS